MKTTKLRKYLADNGISMAQAARECKIAYDYFRRLCYGRPAGRNAAKKISKWSSGGVTVIDVMHPGINFREPKRQ